MLGPFIFIITYHVINFCNEYNSTWLEISWTDRLVSVTYV